MWDISVSPRFRQEPCNAVNSECAVVEGATYQATVSSGLPQGDRVARVATVSCGRSPEQVAASGRRGLSKCRTWLVAIPVGLEIR